MKFWMKLISRCGALFLIAFPISVNSQIVTSFNAYQESEPGTEIAHGADSIPRYADFRTLPFYIGVSTLLHQIKYILQVEQS